MSKPPFPQWQAQSSNAEFSSPEACAKRASKFERQINLRNAIEYVAGAFVFVLFGGLTIMAFVKGEALIGAASAVILAGAGRVIWSLRRNASNLERRPEDACLAHLRRQFQHQYTALRTVPRWYIGPFVPGIMLFFAAITVKTAEVTGWPAAIAGGLFSAAIAFGLFALIIFVNWLAAKALKRKIEAIDALT